MNNEQLKDTLEAIEWAMQSVHSTLLQYKEHGVAPHWHSVIDDDRGDLDHALEELAKLRRHLGLSASAFFNVTLLSKEQIEKIIVEQECSMLFSPRGNGESMEFIYARRGKIVRSLGKLQDVMAMSEEGLRARVAAKLPKEAEQC